MNTQKTHLMAIIAALALLLPTFAWATYPAEVARTGQTTCYDAAGAVIACAGTGQDGDWLAGAVWPNPRFADNGDGTVNDGLTGLVWTKDANLMKTRDASFDADGTLGDGRVAWQHALDYVAKLNSENYLNHNDWRLPNINELESLVNSQLYGPALPQGHPFANMQSYEYWSSTSYAGSTNPAWFVGMRHGFVNCSGKTMVGIVWPVRSGQCGALGNSVICLPRTGQTACYDSAGAIITCTGTGQDGELQKGVAWPSPRFLDNNDGTVIDSLTGLEWTKDANTAGTAKTWQQALDYVNTLTIGGHGNWRLPNNRELRSLVDYSKRGQALPQGHPFTNVQSYRYWSSTSLAVLTFDPWLVDMYDGSVDDGMGKTGYSYVWPVRSGQCGAFDNSTTTTTAGSTTTTVIFSTTSTAPVTTTAPTTTTTISGTNPTACPARQVLGADNPRLESLRNLRDSKLAHSAIGRKAIQIYYNNAGGINAALERSPALQAVARRVLEAVVAMEEK